MADTVHHDVPSSSAAAPAAAQTTEATPQAPVQPNSTHQPAPQGGAATGNYYGQYPQAYGQPYQPYQQYGYQQAYSQQQAAYQPYYHAPAGTYPYPQAAPAPVVPETKFWTATKTFLHGACVIFGVIGLGLGLAFVSNSYWAYMAAIACPVPGLAILWNGSELVVRAVHKFQSGVHPGASVGCCLILWLVAVIVGALEAVYGSLSDPYCEYDYDSFSYSYEPTDCKPEFARIWVAITAFTLLIAAAEFTLFVMACMDTAKRNASKKIVMVVNPAYWGQAAQGWQPMPQDNSHQQPVAAPQHAMARGGNGQDIAMQDRSSSPGTPYATPAEAPVVDEKGKGPAQPAHGVSEFYGGGH